MSAIGKPCSVRLPSGRHMHGTVEKCWKGAGGVMFCVKVKLGSAERYLNYREEVVTVYEHINPENRSEELHDVQKP